MKELKVIYLNKPDFSDEVIKSAAKALLESMRRNTVIINGEMVYKEKDQNK